MDYKKGWGKFKSGTEVEVELSDGGSETLTAKNIIIATGSEVSPLKGIEVDEERWALPSPQNIIPCIMFRRLQQVTFIIMGVDG